ncbi:MAG: excinuclease ABC subunit UvrC [Ruminococcaceae bacterium]|nr:excinuclease ABC subunit UvrC [Oscillospiraceae bacterium]
MIEILREKANKLPLLPGVYIMKDSFGNVIYVGKAKKLKNRVTSYFRGEHLPKVEAMVRKVADFEVIVVNSEFEALVLENSLIKRHMPHYNILLRDDKTYPFIRIDAKSEYPRISIVNRISDDGAKYFGPFGSRGTSFGIISALKKALLLPDCSRKFPRDIGKERPCLNYQMGLCSGFCRGEPDAAEFRARIAQAEMVLSGNSEQLLDSLRVEMESAAEELRFEAAAELRDRMRAIESLSNKQKVIATAFADTDVIGFFRGAKTAFAVLHFNGGNMAGKDFELMDEPLEADAEVLGQLLIQYYTIKGNLPKNILLPFEIEDMEDVKNLLREKSGKAVNISVPQRGEKAELVKSALVNAREEVMRATTQSQRSNKTLEWLQKTLALPSFPNRIESFDISNIGSFGIVAAMVVFVNAKPLKREYRKFRIKETDKQDDYASMYEALYRRFKRCIEGDEKFADVPDLLLIDGGETHAAVAERALADLGLILPVFGMVKDDRHRTRALVNSSGEEIGIIGNQAVFSFVGTVQEEVHRFAIEYHRLLRSENIASELDRIPGVGEKRKAQLLKEFKTVKAISQADLQTLAQVVPSNTAKAVYEYFHQKEKNT